MTKLWIARHAPASVKGICYGHHDVAVELPADVAAARLAATLPAATPPAYVWSSPSLRCADVAARLGPPVRHEPRLREMHFGQWEGRAWNDIEPEPEFRIWARNWREARVPGGESAVDLDARVWSWHRQLDPAQTHYVVAHAGVVRSLRVHVEGATWDDAMRVPVPHLEWLAITPGEGA